jgi:PhoH-like ATPase
MSTTSDLYSGVKVLEVDKDVIDEFYKSKEISLDNFDQRHVFYPNMYIVLKDADGASNSALGKVKGGKVVLLPKDLSAGNVRPKNKEQVFAMDALLDDSIKVVVLTGRAGSGKTICTLAAAISKIEQKKYKKLLLTRIMTQVGSHELGILPGDLDDKFNPYLRNYMCNLDVILGARKDNMEDLVERYNAEFLPFQLVRGASFHDCYIIADECQTLNYHDMLTLGTRVSEGSKIIILGDLKQRDTKIAKDKTGIYKFVNSMEAKESEFVATIELIKSERGPVSTLFANIFEDQ